MNLFEEDEPKWLNVQEAECLEPFALAEGGSVKVGSPKYPCSLMFDFQLPDDV